MERGTQLRTIVLHGKGVVGGLAEGEAMVDSESVSAWSGIDPIEGVIIDKRHALAGLSFRQKVLVLPGGKGSNGWSIMFHIARVAGNCPSALIFRHIDTRTALAAAVSHVPTVTDLNQDPIKAISNGDFVKVYADKGIVEVTKKGIGQG